MFFGKTKDSQRKQVMRLLQSGKSITSMEAFKKFGITRLSAVIYDLKHEYCLDIVTKIEWVKNRNKKTCGVARYYLKEYEQQYN